MTYVYTEEGVGEGSEDEEGEGVDVDVPNNGLWADIPCRKRNLVVCEKPQNWTIDRIQETLIQVVREMKFQKKEYRKLAVPEGFVYIQISGQFSPQKLWPTYSWKDVSASFSGKTFGVENSLINEPKNSSQVVKLIGNADCTSPLTGCPFEPNKNWKHSVVELSDNCQTYHRNCQTKNLEFTSQVEDSPTPVKVWVRV
jgi:hypothetical protein